MDCLKEDERITMRRTTETTKGRNVSTGVAMWRGTIPRSFPFRLDIHRGSERATWDSFAVDDRPETIVHTIQSDMHVPGSFVLRHVQPVRAYR
jgi:hypothetical protein